MINEISPFMRQLLTYGENGDIEAPDNVFMNASAAWQQYTAMRLEHLDRIEVYAGVDGMLGGNPPYDEDELESAGLGHITNFNNFKARSSYEREGQGLWSLINSTEVLIKVVLSDQTIPGGSEFAEKIARNFSDVVKEISDFNINWNLVGSALTKVGWSPVTFSHEKSPLWDVVDVSKFFVPAQTETKLSKLTSCAIDVPHTVQELYQIYKKADEKGPWNKEVLGQFLVNHANTYANNSNSPLISMDQLQSFINNNDTTIRSYFTDIVRITHMYQTEYDGKITHMIISPDMFSDVKTEDNDKVDFMYWFDRQYKKMEEVVIIFTATPGEKTIHGNLGAGQKMFAGSQAVNMLDCGMVDTAKMSGTPIVRTLAAGGREAAPIRFYPGVATDIGAAELIPNNLGANLQPSIAVAQYITATLEKNAVNSGSDPGTPDANQGSIAPSNARYRAIKENSVLRNNVQHVYNVFDKVIAIMFTRFLSCPEGVPGYEYAKEFRDRCTQDGVPPFLMDYAKPGLHGIPKQFRSVKASRVAGDGSTVARIIGLEGLGPIMGTFNQEQMTAFKKETVSATMGVDYISTFVSDSGDDPETSAGHSLAVVENGLMTLGQPAGFSPDDAQGPHAETHLALITNTVQQIQQQQMSPIDGDKLLDLVIPHEVQHVQQMQKSPQFYTQILNAIDKPLKQAIQFAQLNKRNADAMRKAAQDKAQQDAAATNESQSKIQRLNNESQAKIQLDNTKVEAQNARADKANDTRAQIMTKKVEKDAAIKEKKVELDAKIKQDATVKGAAQDKLAHESASQLQAELAQSAGDTPSSVDFEPNALVPGTQTPKNNF